MYLLAYLQREPLRCITFKHSADMFDLGTCAVSRPRSRATSLVNISIIKPNRLRVSAASHRPLDDSSRMNACCAWTSMN